MGKVCAVGDIHTKTWIIEEVESLIKDYDTVIFVGDYADDFGANLRDSIDTWYRLKELCETHDNVQLLLGNHDYIYLNKTPTLQSGYSNATQILINSPENAELKNWLKELPVIKEIDGVSYSHAGITEDWNGSQDVFGLWQDTSPLWARPNWFKYKDTPQVFGHTPSKTCWEVEPNIWCIDTFSTHHDGTPIGDHSILEIIDGKEFKIRSL